MLQRLHVVGCVVLDAKALSAAWLLSCGETHTLSARSLSQGHAVGREAHLTSTETNELLPLHSKQANLLCRVAITAPQLPCAGQLCYSWSAAKLLRSQVAYQTLYAHSL